MKLRAPAALLGAVLAGCGAEPWTVEGVLEPSLERLDRDESGEVDAGDWQHVAYGPTDFAYADQDRDGELSRDELLRLLRTVDPLAFDKAPERVAPDAQMQTQYFPLGWRQRTVRDALRFLAAEVRAVAPDATLPSEQFVKGATRSQDLHGVFGRAALVVLREAHAAAGLDWPEGVDPPTPAP